MSERATVTSTQLWRISLVISRMNSPVFKNLNPQNTLKQNELNTSIITITGELRQKERACHLHYADSKPFRQLKQFELVIFV